MSLAQTTFGKRLGIGFGTLLLMMAAVGALALWQLNSAQKASTLVIEHEVPQMRLVYRFEEKVKAANASLQHFIAQKEGASLREARHEADEADHILREATTAQGDASFLAQLEKVHTPLVSLQEALNTVADTTQALQKQDEIQEKAWQHCKAEAAAFAAHFHEALTAGIHMRLGKLRSAESILSAAMQARIDCNQAQMTGEVALFTRAAEKLGEIRAQTDEIRPITTKQYDLDRFDRIDAATLAYTAAMEAYAALAPGEEAQAPALRAQMAEDAAELTEMCAVYVHDQRNKLAAGAEKRLQIIAAVEAWRALAEDIYTHFLNARAQGDADTMQAELACISTLYAQLEAIATLATKDNGPSWIARLEESLAAYENHLAQTGTLWLTTQTSITQCLVATTDLATRTREMVSASVAKTEDVAIAGSQKLHQAIFAICVSFLVALLAGSFGAWRLGHDLTGKLRQIAGGMLEIVGAIAETAREMTANSGTLAQGASMQASAVEQTSASLQQIAATVRQNAEVSQEADSQMAANRHNVEHASHEMAELMGSMQTVVEKSQAVGQVVQTIDQIAFQTNMLALNAAVESARAGEAGAGFSVVADEVRDLANRAAAAARQSAEIIVESNQEIDHGRRKAESSHQTFETIRQRTQGTQEALASIAASSQEQSNGIEQINAAVTALDEVVQRNAQSAEQGATTSQRLKHFSDRLEASVDELASLTGQALSVPTDLSQAASPTHGATALTHPGRHGQATAQPTAFS